MGTEANRRRVVTLLRVDLKVALIMACVLGAAVALLWAIVEQIWTLPFEVQMLALLLMVTPSIVTYFVAVFLGWLYGYNKGVDGRAGAVGGGWKGVILVIAVIAIVLVSAIYKDAWQESMRTLESMSLVNVVVTSVNTTVILQLVTKALEDRRDWKKVEFHGIFTWDFRKFVEERYTAVREGRTVNF